MPSYWNASTEIGGVIITKIQRSWIIFLKGSMSVIENIIRSLKENNKMAMKKDNKNAISKVK